MYNLWCFVALNGSKISFVAIYAVLSRIFCRDLRAFVWRKIVSKIVCVEKKRQISGVPLTCMYECCHDLDGKKCIKTMYKQIQQSSYIRVYLRPQTSLFDRSLLNLNV